ncbi:hypothetical protein AXF42_Ash000120 [Apostasia shenzhenica]|uniref:Uncharacterized protein n=1 Tax=Apostasia shenzhenica TaxID=1088818 RepID=A0A2I0AFH3_9ASPA|nr:hypothetical protein AXF42_Ash000120 [Apostasia shenzhenica]
MVDKFARISPEQLEEKASTEMKKKKVGLMEKMIIVFDYSESKNETNPSDVEEAENSPVEA